MTKKKEFIRVEVVETSLWYKRGEIFTVQTSPVSVYLEKEKYYILKDSAAGIKASHCKVLSLEEVSHD